MLSNKKKMRGDVQFCKKKKSPIHQPGHQSFTKYIKKKNNNNKMKTTKYPTYHLELQKDKLQLDLQH